MRAKLLKLARAQGEDFQLLLTRYANERLLYRLAKSKHAAHFVLKGASLFTIWGGAPHRATRDLDLLGFGEPGEDFIREVFKDILTVDVADDGVQFDLDSLVARPIRDDQAYGGIRVHVQASITSAKVRLQVDVGFGDAITPEARNVDFPTILDFPAPSLRAYPRETVVAEKIEAIVQLGMANSRMKDYYDLVVLARAFDFDGETLVRAIRATFERRKTPLPRALPVGLSDTFAEDEMKKSQWSGFVRKAGIRDAGELVDTIEKVAEFVAAPLSTANTKSAFTQKWRAGASWSEK